MALYQGRYCFRTICEETDLLPIVLWQFAKEQGITYRETSAGFKRPLRDCKTCGVQVSKHFKCKHCGIMLHGTDDYCGTCMHPQNYKYMLQLFDDCPKD
jgi:hypothetical protein